MSDTSVRNRSQQGFSIVELMVAATLSLFLLGGVMSLFANSRKTYESNERLARLQENGRFALDQMAHDIRSAGYKGCARRLVDISPFNNMLHHDSALLWNFAVPVQGYEASSGAWQPALDALIETPLAGSDILVVRGPKRDSRTLPVTTFMTGTTGEVTVADPSAPDLVPGDIALAGNCRAGSVFRVTAYTHNTTTGVGMISHAGTATPPGNLTTPANKSDSLDYVFDDLSEVTPVQTAAYYVKTNPAGVPSLYRRAGVASEEEIIDGVEALQILYGLDANGDLWVDSYETAQTVASTNRWGRVVSVSIGILVRSQEEYGTEQDTQTYGVLGTDFGPFADRHQRMVFTTTATVRNQTQ